jgi:hypothetical protein
VDGRDKPGQDEVIRPISSLVRAQNFSRTALPGIGTRQRSAGLRLKELPMPDLDQIKQAEQERGTGTGGFPRPGRAIPYLTKTMALHGALGQS